MTEGKNVSLNIRMAEPSDSQALLDYTKQVGAESDNLSFGAEGIDGTVEQEEFFLQSLLESSNQLMLLIEIDDEIIAVGSLEASSNPRFKHSAELGISIKKEYWGQGIGSILMEELLTWAREASPLQRIELDVRVDNKRAIQLYQAFGFQIEGTLRQAFYCKGEYLDLYRMALLIK